MQYKQSLKHSKIKNMIRIQIEYRNGETRQYLPTNWTQIYTLSNAPNVQFVTVYAITPRDFQEYQKKINAQKLDFMRVVR